MVSKQYTDLQGWVNARYPPYRNATIAPRLSMTHCIFSRLPNKLLWAPTGALHATHQRNARDDVGLAAKRLPEGTSGLLDDITYIPEPGLLRLECYGAKTIYGLAVTSQ